MDMNEEKEAVSAPVIRIIWSYVHEDKMHRDELEKHLAALKYSGHIQTWYDGDIQPGGRGKQEMEKHLRAADLILPLISSNFLASNYWWSAEMQQTIQKSKTDGTHIVPVLLSPCDYEGTFISHLEILPKGGKAVTSWTRRHEAYVDVVRNIRTLVEKLLAQKWKAVGDTYYGEQHYEQALSAYEATLRLNSQILPVCIRIGELLLQFSRFEEATNAYDRAIYLNPQNPCLYKKKGDALCGLKQFEGAIVAYDQAIELKSDLGPAYLARGKALDARALQAYEEYKLLAAQSYEKAKDLESRKKCSKKRRG